MNAKEQCFEIYRDAFGDDGRFSEFLFEHFFDHCYYTEKNGKVTAMLFLLPCTLINGDQRYAARYLFAAATARNARGQGYMTRLLDMCCHGNENFIFLKPADDGLIRFYSARGFNCVLATRSAEGECRIEVPEKFRILAGNPCLDGTAYTLMYYGSERNIESIAFSSPMD